MYTLRQLQAVWRSVSVVQGFNSLNKKGTHRSEIEQAYLTDTT
jgi:hypothetical protein